MNELYICRTKYSDNNENIKKIFEIIKNGDNVYEIESNIEWNDLLSFRETSECEKFNIIMDKFQGSYKKKSFPKGFWNSEISQKLYMLILRIRLGFYTIESLYKISFNDFTKNYGGGFMVKYKQNVNLMLTSLYPEQENLRMFGSFEGLTISGTLKVDCWDEKNPLQPHEVSMHSNKIFKFKCDVCPHTFDYRLFDIVNGHWCPYCANKKLCEDTKSCQTCLEKTFHSFKGKTSNGKLKVQCCSPENNIKPHELFMNSHKIFKFKCDECHETFDSLLTNIVKGQWCPTCKNKTEKLVLDILQNKFSKKDVKRRFTHEKVRNIRHLPFDICILLRKIIIEVDGQQHFKDISYFKSNAVEQCEQDCKKMKIISEEGYSVIRIVQEDIWLAKTQEEMKTKLEKAIQECISNNGPMIHYISMDDSMYDNHELKFKELNK